MMDPNWLVISVTGITGGGKSDLCTLLFKSLPNTAKLIRQDDYFLPLESPYHVKCSNGLDHINWDIITSLDMDKMVDDIQEVIKNPPEVTDKSQISYANMVKPEDTSTTRIGSWPVKSASNLNISVLPTDEDSKSKCTDSNSGTCVSVTDTSKCCSSTTSTSLEVNIPSTSRPVLVLDGFILLDDPRILQLTHKAYFFSLNKEECIRRRDLRCFDPPDIPGYFDGCVWPMYESYLTCCKEHYDQMVSVSYLDGASDQETTHSAVLKEVMEMAVAPKNVLMSKMRNQTPNRST